MRQIYKVFATQVVTSAQNPQGVLSDITGYPKSFDSRSYKATEANPNGDEEIAFLAAQADYLTESLALASADNANRVAWNVSIIRAGDGKQVALKSFGAFPDMTPEQTQPFEESENIIYT